MPNSFSGTLFNRHHTQYKSGALNTKFSGLHLFFPSITDRVEDINWHRRSVNLLPVDISKETFEVEGGVQFDPSKLDYDNPDREEMREAVLKMLKKVIELSNANLVKNADRLLAKKSIEQNVEWVGADQKRLPDNRYKMFY